MKIIKNIVYTLSVCFFFSAALAFSFLFINQGHSVVGREIDKIVYCDEDNNYIHEDNTAPDSETIEEFIIDIDGYSYSRQVKEALDDLLIYKLIYKKIPKPIKEQLGNEGYQNNGVFENLCYGDYGCLVVPSIGLIMPISYREYCSPKQYWAVQNVIDTSNLCCIYNLYGNILISDHYNQGFWKILNLQINDFVYIYRCNGEILKYKCAEIGKGYFAVDNIAYNGTNLIKNKLNGIFIETCNGNDNVNTFMARLYLVE